MVKSTIKNIGTGILNSMEEMEDISEQKNTGIKEQKGKPVKESKTKRSFMLTDSQIDKIYLLKSMYHGRDLSDLVGEAIERFYEDEIKKREKQ